jgi:cytochrome c-type biogenesis protein CcmH
MLKFLTLFFLFSYSFAAFALTPEARLSNQDDEQRAMNLFLQVRCLVCGGQVIENSDSAFSASMRKLIREKISQNKSDAEIKAELVDEFGEDILTEVDLKNDGLLLWLLPLIFVVGAGIFLAKSFSRRH